MILHSPGLTWVNLPCLFLQFSTLYPEMVDSVVLLDSYGFFPTDPVTFTIKIELSEVCNCNFIVKDGEKCCIITFIRRICTWFRDPLFASEDFHKFTNTIFFTSNSRLHSKMLHFRLFFSQFYFAEQGVLFLLVDLCYIQGKSCSSPGIQSQRYSSARNVGQFVRYDVEERERQDTSQCVKLKCTEGCWQHPERLTIYPLSNHVRFTRFKNVT